MFSIFKSKPKLSELIPAKSVDFHSHILYGLDDGAQSKEDTVFLMESLEKLGFSTLIASPHTTPFVWENTKEGILSQCEKIQSELPELADRLGLRTASEYLMDNSFLARIEKEKLLTIKDSYILVEMSYIAPPVELFEIIFKLKTWGYIPVLAHPERYKFYHNSTDTYKKLKDSGCLFQLNLLSTTGYYGEAELKTTDWLLKQDMYDFAATDTHHQRHIKAYDSKIKVKDSKKITELISNNQLFR